MTTTSNKKSLPERIDKTLNWLETSRNCWRDKTKVVKAELKKKNLAVKRARESKEEYKELMEKQERAFRDSQDMLEKKNLEILHLQEQLAQAQEKIEELKKKKLRQ